ncbi:FAD-dependent oxidoreductase [Acidiferrimicrobium sp. IK]|uniref:FAD-dependent oxidoreductase n=1 Tax=Acidiferrimicrobium sp. IK TaxID=2871700 RepID=UPI0021CAFD9C|nr:FAD-dependent oxidoreductase [Acidiferrimicrobium sp. IK]MCU4183217.1 FAD-dependent oxidoreductase [Acidiferrimicrobium sp. IK]
MHDADLLVVGAGPYGLSIGAHARRAGLAVTVLGHPMESWAPAAAVGSRLVSDGFGSNLSDPDGRLTLRAFCSGAGRGCEGAGEYRDVGWPVPAGLLRSYADWFVAEAGVEVDERTVTALRSGPGAGRSRSGPAAAHTVTLDDGATLSAPVAVVALGLAAFPFTAPVLDVIDASLALHSGALGDPARLAGRSVAVLGGGQSALESAALLAEAGAHVTVLVRRASLSWQPRRPEERSAGQRLLAPRSALGDGWRPWAASRAPELVRLAPGAWRGRLANRAAVPAGAWWLRARVEGSVDIRLATTVVRAEAVGDRAVLHLDGPGGGRLQVDQVVSATGYRPDVGRLRWLDAPGLLDMAPSSASPRLSRRFESSRPGLCFTGALAASSFGPAQLLLAGVAPAAGAVTVAARRYRRRGG